MTEMTDLLIGAFHGMIEILHRKRGGLPSEKLTMPQFLVLVLTDKGGSDGGGMTVSGLARHLRLSAPTVTGIVDRLVEAGLVDRRRTAPDRRFVEVVATARGHSLVGEVVAAREERLGRFFEAMDEADARALLQGLEAFRQAIIKVTQGED
jgi:DNA-binding MarR family transcriptional regulator